MDVPDLYSAIVEEPVPDGLSEVVHIEEIYKKWQHQQQEQCRLLETIRDLAEENKRILKERDELREECSALKKSNSVYKKNAQLIYSVCRCEINKRERKMAALERKLSARHPECEIRDLLPSDHDEDYYGKIPLNLDTELKYTGILSELSNDTSTAMHSYSKDLHGRMPHYPSGSRDTPFDCRPFRGPKTPPTPNCVKANTSKTRLTCSSELHDRKRVARPSWDNHYDSRSKYCRYDDYETIGDYYDREKRSNSSRMDYRRSYSSERKYDRHDGYSNDLNRQNYVRHKRDEERVAHHSNNRLSYSQSGRHSERDKNYEECYDRSRSSEDHYRRDWNDNDYHRSRDSFSRDASRDRRRKSLDYEEEDAYHDHRSRYSQRNYEYEMESSSQDQDDGHRSRKFRDGVYHSKSAERYRDQESVSGRSERFRGASRERFRPMNGRSHLDNRSHERAPNDIDSRSCSSSSHADQSLDRSHDDGVESAGNFDSNFDANTRDGCAPDSSHSKRDSLRHDYEVKEMPPSARRTTNAPLSPSSSSSPSQVESPSEDETSIAVAATEGSAGDESSRAPPPLPPPPPPPPPSVETEPKRKVPEPEPKGKPQESVVEAKSFEGNTKLPQITTESITSPEPKKKMEGCPLTAAETKLRKLKESKPILFTKVKDTPKNDEMDFIKTSLDTSFRHDVAHYTSKQIHNNTSVKDGHPPDEFAVLEGLRIQKAEEEAAKEDYFVLGSEYKKSKDENHINGPTESVYSQRMREKLEREKSAVGKNVAINKCPEPTANDTTSAPESTNEETAVKEEEEQAAVNASPQSLMTDVEEVEVEPTPTEEVVEEEFDVADNLVTELESPESEKITSPETPVDGRDVEVLPFDRSLSNVDTATVNSTVGSESVADGDGVDSFDIKSPDDCQQPVIELAEGDVKEDTPKQVKRIERSPLAPSGSEPPPEALEWDCEVDLHLEEVDTTNVSAETVSASVPSPSRPADDAVEEEGLTGEVEEGEILEDSEPEECNGEEKTVKKKKKSRRMKAKPKAKEKWKGKKGLKSKKARIGKGIISGRRETDSTLKSNAQSSRHASPDHQAANPSKIDLRSRDKKSSRLGHHEIEVGKRANSFPSNRRRGGSEKYVEAAATAAATNNNNDRRAAIDRNSRSQAKATRRDGVKEPKRFRGRGSDDGAAPYRSLSPPRSSAAQGGSKSRHYDLPEHRFRRK